MPIYAKPVRLLMKDMADSFVLQAGQSFTRQQAIDWFAQHYPKIRPGTVHCHLIRLSTNAPTRLHYNAKPHEDDVFFQLDGGHFRLYDPAHDPTPIYDGSTIPKGKRVIEDEAEPECSGEFAYEADLRNYLAKNLSIIEPGLKLYQEEGITGVEFDVGGAFLREERLLGAVAPISHHRDLIVRAVDLGSHFSGGLCIEIGQEG